MITIPMGVASDRATVEVGASSSDVLVPVDVGAVVTILPHPYTGPYEVTPTQEEQILQTAGGNMVHDVVVHKIPSCYGLVTWNGATLTIS